MNRSIVLKGWALAMGSMDAVTGLLLVLRPALVAGLLGITVPDEGLVFLRWIGVFVMAVGLSYGFALWKEAQGEPVWAFTALVRVMVALFLTWQIVTGGLPSGWAVVALSDGVVGVAQVVMLRLGWWKESSE